MITSRTDTLAGRWLATQLITAIGILGFSAIASANNDQKITVTGDNFYAMGPQGGPFLPSSIQYTIEAPAPSAAPVVVKITPPANFVATPQTVSAAPGEKTVVTVTVNAAGVPPGTYTGSITFEGPGGAIVRRTTLSVLDEKPLGP